MGPAIASSLDLINLSLRAAKGRSARQQYTLHRAFLFDAVEAAEFGFRAATGLFWADSSGDVIGDLPFEMKAQLLIEFCLRKGFLKEAANPAHHQDFSFARKIKPTASQRRFQFTTSVSMCLWPFLVSSWNLAWRPVSDSFHLASSQPLSSKRWSAG